MNGKRLIYAEDLLAQFPVGGGVTAARARRAIERAETVDAVEVVRCGECKNNGGEISQGDIWCDKMERGMIGNCYCSYGIRKEAHSG